MLWLKVIGRMVRLIMFQSGLIEIGTTGWKLTYDLWPCSALPKWWS